MNQKDKCPFCGYNDVLLLTDLHDGRMHAACNNCHATGPVRSNSYDAWYAWRRRPLDPDKLESAKNEALRNMLQSKCPSCSTLACSTTLDCRIGMLDEKQVVASIHKTCPNCNHKHVLWEHTGDAQPMFVLRRAFVKRGPWSTDEVLHILRGQKLITRDGNSRDEAYHTTYNEAVEDCIGTFEDFLIPPDEPGAMAYDLNCDMVVHIGAVLPRIEVHDKSDIPLD